MAIKTLKLKRVFAYTIYRSLKSTPPKEYPSTGEIKLTINDILPALKKNIEEYVKMSAKVDALSVKVQAKELKESELQGEVDKINEEFKDYNKEHGNEIVEVALDGESFTALKSQFERDDWGKTWVQNIEEFSELMDVFAEAEKSDKK
mgnify:FL=1